MNKSFDFSQYSRQSVKGILILYIQQIYAILKVSWVLIFFIVKDFSKVSKIGEFYIYAGGFLLLTFFLVRAILLYRNFKFKIVDGHFILQKGILKKTDTSIPFERIQNINFKQNLIHQIINIHELTIETAGSSNTEISIKAIELDKAKALKEVILESGKIVSNTINTNEDKPLLKVSVLELLKVSLTENHLKNLFLFLALLVGFFQQIQQIAEGFGKVETLDGFIEQSSSALATSFALLFLALIFLIIIGFISSFVRVFLVHFNLSAYLKNNAFEINQGLFTKKSILLKKQKIQTITISTNPLKRLIGISYVTFKQAVSGKINTKKEKVIRIVGCKNNQIETIKNSLFTVSEFKDLEKQYPDSYYKNRIYIYSFLLMAIVYVTIIFFLKEYKILFSLALVLPILLISIRKKVQKRFYKLSENYLCVGKGIIETHNTILELFKVQNIKLTQTFFQKRKDVANLVLQTASGKITLPCLTVKEALFLYNYVLFKVETSQKEWM